MSEDALLGEIAERFEEGFVDEAKERLEVVLREYPDSYGAHNLMGNILSDLDEGVGAIRFYRRAIEIDPDAATAYFSAGIHCRRAGRLPEALDFYERALEREPDAWDIHCGYANALKDLHRLDDAVEHYYRSIALQKSVSALNNLARLLIFLHRTNEAETLLDEALEMEPDDADLRSNKAVCLIHTDRYAEAAAIVTALAQEDWDD